MNCEDFNIFLDRTLRDALSPDERTEMERHADVCRDCARLLSAQRLIGATFEATEPVRAPQGLADRIRSRVAAEASGVVLPFTAPSSTSVTCDMFGENAVAFVDGLLSDERAQAMSGHRASCPACDRLALAHETVVAAFANTEPVSAPAGLADRIRAAAFETETAAESLRAPMRYRKFDLFAAAAAFVSIITGSLLFLHLRTSGTVTPGPATEAVDTCIFRITMLPALFEAWIARMIPAEQWIIIARLLEPVQLPYLPFSFSRIFYLAVGIGAVATWGLTWRLLRNPMPLRQQF